MRKIGPLLLASSIALFGCADNTGAQRIGVNTKVAVDKVLCFNPVNEGKALCKPAHESGSYFITDVKTLKTPYGKINEKLKLAETLLEEAENEVKKISTFNF